jgi:hypothetical protein
MMKYLILICLLIGVKWGNCCDCNRADELNDYEFNSYSLIITGKIIRIENNKGNIFLVIKVETFYKGDTLNRIIKINNPPEAFCGLSARIGEKWLIYAYLFTYKNKTYLRTDICSRSKSFSRRSLCCYLKDEMNADLKFLNNKKFNGG